MISQTGSSPDRDVVTTAAVVLAAGAGSRFFGENHKLLTEVAGKPIVRHAVDAARAAGFDEVIVVSGCVDLTEVMPQDITIVHNEHWDHGQAISLRGAVTYAASRGHKAIVVGLGDQPGVGSGAWVAVRDSQADFAAADFGDGNCPPVRLAAAMWASLPVSGDEGARSLWRERPETLESIPCDGDAADVDTLEDLRRWEQNHTEFVRRRVGAGSLVVPRTASPAASFAAPITVTDSATRKRVAELLGREPEGAFEVVVNDEAGDPLVIRNSPFLDDGRPMPTRYWLVGEHARRAVSRLESSGGVRRAEEEVDPDALVEAHARYAAERDAVIEVSHSGPRPSGGVGGTRTGVKCLHAHFAWYLAGGDDPVGRWVAEQLGIAFASKIEAGLSVLEAP